MNEKIKNALDTVEPQPDAKERMYQNILKKAEKEKKPKVSPVKTARIVLPIAACLCFVIFGVGKFLPVSDDVENPDESVMFGGYPYVEVEDASSFAALGITVDAPKDALDKSYAIIGGEIAEIKFTLDGHSYRLRASKSEDISGINGEIISREPIDDGAELITIKTDGIGECKLAEWTSDGTYFSLSASDGTAGDTLCAVFEKIK